MVVNVYFDMSVIMSIFLLFDSQLTVIGAGAAERVGLIGLKPYNFLSWINIFRDPE